MKSLISFVVGLIFALGLGISGMTQTHIVRGFLDVTGDWNYALMGVMADNIVEGDGEISIPDFGRFSIKHVAERQGVNPATGEKITIAARDKVVFKASDSLPYFSRKHSNE